MSQCFILLVIAYFSYTFCFMVSHSDIRKYPSLYCLLVFVFHFNLSNIKSQFLFFFICIYAVYPLLILLIPDYLIHFVCFLNIELWFFFLYSRLTKTLTFINMADMFGVRYVIIYVILPDFYKIFIDFYHMYSSQFYLYIF